MTEKSVAKAGQEGNFDGDSQLKARTEQARGSVFFEAAPGIMYGVILAGIAAIAVFEKQDYDQHRKSIAADISTIQDYLETGTMTRQSAALWAISDLVDERKMKTAASMALRSRDATFEMKTAILILRSCKGDGYDEPGAANSALSLIEDVFTNSPERLRR
jgi:hypothetical protein